MCQIRGVLETPHRVGKFWDVGFPTSEIEKVWREKKKKEETLLNIKVQ